MKLVIPILLICCVIKDPVSLNIFPLYDFTFFADIKVTDRENNPVKLYNFERFFQGVMERTREFMLMAIVIVNRTLEQASEFAKLHFSNIKTLFRNLIIKAISLLGSAFKDLFPLKQTDKHRALALKSQLFHCSCVLIYRVITYPLRC